MAGIKSFENVTGIFAGQGDLIFFDAPSDYASATFAALTNPKSFGQIVQDSTSWEGEDPETTTIKDEQGNLITTKTVAGTLGFSFEIASTSKSMVKKFLGGTEFNATTLGTNSNFNSGVTATGFGTELPVLTLPIMILNDEKTRAWLYPKSKVVSNLSYSDGLWRIKANVTCEYLKTSTLRTGMILELPGGALYDTTTE